MDAVTIRLATPDHIPFVDTSNEWALRTYRATRFAPGGQHGVVSMIVRFDAAPPG